MSFWELLFLQSLYMTASDDNMAKIIVEQPNTNIFFKSYLELELSNLVTLLSFDNRSIKALLSSLENFDHDYPIFYKQKPQADEELVWVPIFEEYEYKTAIDVALENNQIQAVDLMISYICNN